MSLNKLTKQFEGVTSNIESLAKELSPRMQKMIGDDLRTIKKSIANQDLKGLEKHITTLKKYDI